MTKQFDIAVIGSGFGGSIMAMVARRLGHSVILIDKGRHPRFAIGESSTPLANLLLEEIARDYDLPQLLPLTNWGDWQMHRPELACGLKRGFSFFHHSLGHAFAHDPEHRNQLLVAASPHDRVADTHWYRPHFDRFLVAEARRLGVNFSDDTALEIKHHNDRGFLFRALHHGRSQNIQARFVIDATGPRGFLFRALQLSERAFPHLPATEGLFAHFRGVKPLQVLPRMKCSETPPYPVDDAAVHHIFEGGWIWILRFNNGITSAGVAATREVAEKFGLADGEAGWRRLLKKLPTVEKQFRSATLAHPFVHAPTLSFAAASCVGAHWAMLPSSAGFIDPLLSTGFPLTLLGIQRLAKLLELNWSKTSMIAPLKKYARVTFAELSGVEDLVSALYANFHDFEIFAALSRLYFAAVSFSEAARRLRSPHESSAFLLHSKKQFGAEMRLCCDLARQSLSPGLRKQLLTAIHHAIAPIDVAGLTDSSRQNWFPVKGEDLLSATRKLSVPASRIRNFLHANGF